jgi:hypothetical protein
LGAKCAYGGEVTGVREVPLDIPNDGRTRQEEDAAYGYEITTTKGVVSLAFRNSSNGYYGGWAEAISAKPNTEWHEITTNDWRAS